MKLNFSEKRRGIMRPDILVAVLLTFLLFTILFILVLPVNEAARRRADRIICVNNLKQICVASRIGEGVNRNPADPRAIVLETNSQTVGLKCGQIAWIQLIGISNILHSSKILQCPLDRETPTTTNVAGVKIRISYFLNLDANEGYPQMILDGDDDLLIDGKPIKSGLIELPPNLPIAWSRTRHKFCGNIGLADGSVEEQSVAGLKNALQYSTNGTPYLTNRFAIP